MYVLTSNRPLPRALACALLLAGAGLHAAPLDDLPLDARIHVEDFPALDEQVLANMDMGDCVADCGKVVTLGGRRVFVLLDGSGTPSLHFAPDPDPGGDAFWSMALEVAKRQGALRHVPTLDEAMLEALNTRACAADCGATFFVGGHYTLVWRDAEGHASLHLRGDGNDLAWAPIFARYDVVRPRTVDISSIETGSCVADCRALVRVGARLGLATRDAEGGLLLHFSGEPPHRPVGRAEGRWGAVSGNAPIVPPECPAGPTANSDISVTAEEKECACTPVEVQYEVTTGGRKVKVTTTRTRWTWAETLVFRNCFGAVIDRRARSGDQILPAGSNCPC